MLRIDHPGARSRETGLEQIEARNAGPEIRCEGQAQKQAYHRIGQVLGRQEYRQAEPPGARVVACPGNLSGGESMRAAL
jgi:hypothetical protein